MPLQSFELLDRGRRLGPTPRNHNAPWSRELEDELLRQFANGAPIDVLASSFERTTGSINSRLSQLLGIRYPDTPNQYRARGNPIRRRGERRNMPGENSRPEPVLWTLEPNTFDLDAVFAHTIQRAGRVRRERRAETTIRPAEPPPVAEVPSHLEARMDMDNLAAQILAARPASREGRVAAAQHSALNKVAHNFANLIQATDAGEAFDRAKWLEACGVQTAEGN